jgi:hypothetical protein
MTEENVVVTEEDATPEEGSIGRTDELCKII